MRLMFWTGTLAAGALLPALAIGQAAPTQVLSPAAAVQARQAQFREIGTAFKAINDELRKPAPGRFVMGSSARTIAANLRHTGRMFPAGSGPSPSLKTKALPAIWSRQAEFNRLNAAAIMEADRLAAALRGTDVAAIRSQTQALGRTCKACHDPFREEGQH